MQLEEEFDFSPSPFEAIRIKGTRIGVDEVVRLHLQHMIPEQIAVYFCSPLNVEQVYTTITFYLKNREYVDGYIMRVDERADRLYQEYLQRPQSELLTRILALKKERERQAVRS